MWNLEQVCTLYNCQGKMSVEIGLHVLCDKATSPAGNQFDLAMRYKVFSLLILRG